MMHRTQRLLATGAAAALQIPVMVVTAAPAAADPVQPDCDTIWQRTGSGFYEDNPTYTETWDDSGDWQFATPAQAGLDGDLLDDGVDGLFANDSLLSVIVLRHGELVYERYDNGGGQFQSNAIHSASKSMLQALVGIAIEDGDIGDLDDKASWYLPQQFSGQSSAKKNIRIGQLLDMTSGLNWTEDQTEYSIENKADWVKAIVNRSLWYTPGTEFNYSTGNTHVLSAVLEDATGMSTCEYAQAKLFGPMNITPEHWGRDPQGINSGGYNVSMTARELAKFGQLYLQDGYWNGQQLVPSYTVAEASTPLHDDGDGFWYDSGWWSRTISGVDMHFAWGWGGQFLYVIPELDLVFSTTQNTNVNHTNVEINSGDFIRDYLLPAIEDTGC